MTTPTKSPPCANCGQIDWQFDAAGIHCLACGTIRETRKVADRKAAQMGFRSLADLLNAERARAETVQIDEATLAEWYELQLAAERKQLNALAAAFEERCDRTGLNPEHPLFEETWLYRARVDYQSDTVALLEKAGHVLVCPTHGIRGVTAECDWDGLSSRGLVIGDGPKSWLRYCPRCSSDGIKTRGEALRREAISARRTGR